MSIIILFLHILSLAFGVENPIRRALINSFRAIMVRLQDDFFMMGLSC